MNDFFNEQQQQQQQQKTTDNLLCEKYFKKNNTSKAIKNKISKNIFKNLLCGCAFLKYEPSKKPFVVWIREIFRNPLVSYRCGASLTNCLKILLVNSASGSRCNYANEKDQHESTFYEVVYFLTIQLF